MPRRLLLAGLVVVALAACGSGSPTASPASPSTAASQAPSAAASEAPWAAAPTDVPSAPASTVMTAACGAVGIRKLPSVDGALVVRIAVGTQVRVVEPVTGDPYTVATCGAAGSAWLKIDQVDGKGVKALYGVEVVFAAAGFFK